MELAQGLYQLVWTAGLVPAILWRQWVAIRLDFSKHSAHAVRLQALYRALVRLNTRHFCRAVMDLVCDAMLLVAKVAAAFA